MSSPKTGIVDVDEDKLEHTGANTSDETKLKEEALKEKEQGNEAFKSRNFTMAIKHYQAAIKFDPSQLVFYSNLSATYFEVGDLSDCVPICEKAIKMVENNNTTKEDGKMLGKIWNRLGNCQGQKGEMKKAISSYENALKSDPSLCVQDPQ